MKFPSLIARIRLKSKKKPLSLRMRFESIGPHNSLFSTTFPERGGAKVCVERSHCTKDEEPVFGEAIIMSVGWEYTRFGSADKLELLMG